MRRRTWLAAASAVAAAPLAGCGVAEVTRFPTLAAARQAVQALDPTRARSTGAWTLAQVLDHAAQSIEYSLAGFPQMKPAAFRATVGAAAWAVFSARGAMRHGLDEPIPGAPALDVGRPLADAQARLLAAMDRFEAHAGPLAPHFAYGALDKAAYTRAHLLHLANHWQDVQDA